MLLGDSTHGGSSAHLVAAPDLEAQHQQTTLSADRSDSRAASLGETQPHSQTSQQMLSHVAAATAASPSGPAVGDVNSSAHDTNADSRSAPTAAAPAAAAVNVSAGGHDTAAESRHATEAATVSVVKQEEPASALLPEGYTSEHAGPASAPDADDTAAAAADADTMPVAAFQAAEHAVPKATAGESTAASDNSTVAAGKPAAATDAVDGDAGDAFKEADDTTDETADETAADAAADPAGDAVPQEASSDSRQHATLPDSSSESTSHAANDRGIDTDATELGGITPPTKGMQSALDRVQGLGSAAMQSPNKSKYAKSESWQAGVKMVDHPVGELAILCTCAINKTNIWLHIGRKRKYFTFCSSLGI